MFLDNKYTKVYFRLIDQAQNKKRTRYKQSSPLYEYWEKHHIIPRSMGGDNTKENLVLLTAREHFICHKLLVKMCISTDDIAKMSLAIWGFINKHQFKVNSRQYEELKKVVARTISQRLKGKKRDPNAVRKTVETRRNTGGFAQTEETKHKISKARLGRDLSEPTRQMVETRKARGNYNHTDATRAKMCESQKHRPLQTEETKQKRSATLRGREFSQQHRENLSIALKGRIPWNKGLRKGAVEVDLQV